MSKREITVELSSIDGGKGVTQMSKREITVELSSIDGGKGVT